VEVQKVQEAPNTAAPSTEDFATILNELIELDGSLRSRATDMLANAKTLHQRYTGISARWSSASDHSPPPDDVVEQYHQRVHAFTELFEVLDRLVNREAELRRLLELLPTDRAREISEPTVLWRAQRKGAQAAAALDSEVSRMGWPEGLPKPALLADVGTRLAAFRTFEEQASERARTLETAAGELIVALEQQIEAGNLDAAVSRDAELRSLLKDLPHEQSRSLRQQAQPLERLHQLGKVADRFAIRKITFLRNVAKRQMLADQPLDGFRFLIAEAQPGADFERDIATELGMVAATPLGDVVQ
jgi:hypothetical protein